MSILQSKLKCLACLFCQDTLCIVYVSLSSVLNCNVSFVQTKVTVTD